MTTSASAPVSAQDMVAFHKALADLWEVVYPLVTELETFVPLDPPSPDTFGLANTITSELIGMKIQLVSLMQRARVLRSADFPSNTVMVAMLSQEDDLATLAAGLFAIGCWCYSTGNNSKSVRFYIPDSWRGSELTETGRIIISDESGVARLSATPRQGNGILEKLKILS